MSTTTATQFLSLTLLALFLATAQTLYVSPSSRALADANWKRSIAEGTRLFEAMKSGCYPDTVHPIDVGALKAIGFRIGEDGESQWPPIFQQASVWTTGQEMRFKWTLRQNAYWRTSVDRIYREPWEDISKFSNEYSTRNGLIAALSTTRIAAAETLSWSSITFALWSALTTFTATDIRNIRFIASHSITHPGTQSIINHIVEGERGIVKDVTQGTPDFMALLGTPAGKDAVFLLMQHKRQLGHKVIVKATVFGKSQERWKEHGPDVVFGVINWVAGAEEHGNATASSGQGAARSVCPLSSSSLERNGTVAQA
ncbi:MAG: hypothetical protein Q9168_008370 [Polycauliona sp. 1 TL-2023]